MISSQAELETTIEQLNRMYRALASIHAKIPRNSSQYDLFTEGPWENIRRLQGEIDEYLARPAAESDARNFAAPLVE